MTGYLLSTHSGKLAFATFLSAAPKTESQILLHLLFSLGLTGMFLVSIVDSSFVPLPIPGMTDIMLVIYAARDTNPWLLIAIATSGSALGGLFSHKVGQAGGLAFIEKRVPQQIFKRVTGWMESHAILAVALPAILPPPMPLSPFVLAAGALNMSRKKFMITFTLSRLVRHSIAVWLGIRYGRNVLAIWRTFSATWGTTILTIVWTLVGITLGYATWQLWKTSRAVKSSKPIPVTESAPN